LAEQSGNKLTQTLNEQGELVGVAQTQGTDFAVDADEAAEGVTLDDVRKQLFSAENVVLHPERSDRGLSSLSQSQSNEVKDANEANEANSDDDDDDS
jgi:hypothetical protein